MSIYLEFLSNYKNFIKNVKYKVKKETKDFYICMGKNVPKNKEGKYYRVKNIIS